MAENLPTRSLGDFPGNSSKPKAQVPHFLELQQSKLPGAEEFPTSSQINTKPTGLLLSCQMLRNPSFCVEQNTASWFAIMILSVT